MSNMTDERLKEIEQRAKKATGGKWWWVSEGPELKVLTATRISPQKIVVSANGFESLCISEEDKAFIAHARQDIPDLLVEVRRLRAETEELRRESKLRDEITGCEKEILRLQNELEAAEQRVRELESQPSGVGVLERGLGPIPKQPEDQPGKVDVERLELCADAIIRLVQTTAKPFPSKVEIIAIIRKHLPSASLSELKVGEPCPKCKSKFLGVRGPGEYSCASCGMGMVDPCEHWKAMQEDAADQDAGLRCESEGQEKCSGCQSNSIESHEHDGCLVDKVVDKELGRWQQAIYELCSKHAIAPDCIDGGGTDSGDPLDFTLAEIGQVICQLENPQDYRSEPEGQREAAQVEGWVSIKEPPKIGQWAIVVIGGVVQRQAAHLETADIDLDFIGKESPLCWVWADESADTAPFDVVTHWRPLPSPPGTHLHPKQGAMTEERLRKLPRGER